MAEGERLRQTLRAGERLLGCWVNMASPIATEIVAGAGFDLIMIDQEHGPGDALAAIGQQQAIRAGAPPGRPVAACLRVHDNQPQLIKRALDSGIDGLMVPLVESAEAAADVVAACLMPPAGRRGVAPGNVRAAGYGYAKDRFVAAGGRDVFVAIQVETEAISYKPIVILGVHAPWHFVKPSTITYLTFADRFALAAKLKSSAT